MYSKLSPAGRRITAAKCAERAATWQGGFYLPRSGENRAAYGYRPVASREAAEARLRAWARGRAGRADGRATAIALARVLSRRQRWFDEELSIPVGHQQLADDMARLEGRTVSRTTVQRLVAEMVSAGVLFVTFHGSSAAANGWRNTVSVYVVTEPDALAPTDQEAVDRLAAELDEHLPNGEVDLGTVGDGARLEPGPETLRRRRARPARSQRPELFVPRDDPRDRWTAAAWLLEWLGWLFDDEEHRRLAQNLRPFFAAGWTVGSVASALQRYPDGQSHRTPLQDDAGVRDHGAVIMHRLGWWRDARRRPLPPPVAAVRIRRGPQPAWLAAESAALPSTVGLTPATEPPTLARTAMAAAIAAGRAAAAAREAELRARRRIGPAQ